MVTIWKNEDVEWLLNFAVKTEDNSGGGWLELSVACRGNGKQTLTVGLGKAEEFTLLAARRAVAHGVNELKKFSVKSAVVDITTINDMVGDNALPIAAEAARLALFKRENWKSKDKNEDFTLYIDAAGQPDAEKILNTATGLAEAVIFARDLVNKPANKLTPAMMAEAVTEAAKKANLQTEVLDAKAMEKLGMGALLAVGQSSANEPKMVTIAYTGNPGSKDVLALVGKGVTFDTGGYNLKSTAGMAWMQGDMAGAASVCAAIVAAANQKLKINVLAVMPMVENRISPSSFLPGDVLTSMSGKTIEIGSTDAEGRLILADAITYAIRNKGVTRIVDIATLTGAVVGMFGHTTAGLMTNDDAFCSAFMEAASQAGERFWQLPSFPEYRKLIESPVADLYNISNDGCGTIAAGLFLEAFAEDKPWIHLDVAGTARLDKPYFEFQSKGGSGMGVTTLYQLCHLLAEK